MSEKPSLPMVLGTGPLADAMRRTIEADPDRYRPITFSIRPVAWCECCKRHIHRVKNRHTNWEEGYAPMEDDSAVHSVLASEQMVGCCCPGPPPRSETLPTHRLLGKKPRAPRRNRG